MRRLSYAFICPWSILRPNAKAGEVAFLADLLDAGGDGHLDDGLGRSDKRRQHSRAQAGDLEPQAADAVTEGLEPLLCPAQSAHEVLIVGLP